MNETIDSRLRQNRVLLDLIGDKWTILVLGSLCDHQGKRRFNEIRRDVAGISQKSLTACLRRLERNGLLERRVLTSGPLGVEYSFTALGNSLDGPVTTLLTWTARYASLVSQAQRAYDGPQTRGAPA